MVASYAGTGGTFTRSLPATTIHLPARGGIPDGMKGTGQPLASQLRRTRALMAR